jgi:hypothetical protein
VLHLVDLAGGSRPVVGDKPRLVGVCVIADDFRCSECYRGVEAGRMESIGNEGCKMSENGRRKAQVTFLQRGRPVPDLALIWIPQ